MTSATQPRPSRFRRLTWAAVAVASVAGGCQRSTDWNSVFSRKEGWMYADGGSSARLPGGRTVWLFGDSILHHDHGFLSNTIAVQDGEPGRAPAQGEMRFFARGERNAPLDVSQHTEDGMRPWLEPALARGTWLWPTDAIASGDQLVAFYTEVGCVEGKMPECRGYIGDMGFFGHTVLVIDNAAEDPSRWKTHATSLVDRRGQPPSAHRLHWGSALLEDAGWIYVFGTEFDASRWSRDVKLARVTLADVARYDKWQFLGPSGWQMFPTGPMPLDLASVAKGGATELSVERVMRGGESWFVMVQVDVNRADVVVRTVRARDIETVRFPGPEPGPSVRRFPLPSLDSGLGRGAELGWARAEEPALLERCAPR